MLYLLLLAISLCWVDVLADYTIDDSNYSVLKFSEKPAGPVWGPFGSDTGTTLQLRLPNGTMQTIDATQCYDGTFNYAACATANDCEVQFSFTGSGITIYVLQAGPQGMSASLSIDSGTATTATLDAPPAPQYYILRVVLFDVQNIQSGTHTAMMKVLNWNGSISGMMLDYVYVNEVVVANPTTSSTPSSTTDTTPQPSTSSPSSPTSANSETTTSEQQMSSTNSLTSSGVSSSATSVLSFQSSGVTTLPSSTSTGNSTSSSTSKRTVDGAVVGGAVGGAIFLLALSGLALVYLERRGRLPTANEGLTSSMLPLRPNARFANTDAASINAVGPLQSPTDLETGSTPNYGDWDQGSPVSGVGDASSIYDTLTFSAPLAAPATMTVTSPSTGYPDDKSPEPGPASRTDSPQQDAVSSGSLDMPETHANTNLTDGQVDFVHGLFNNNVPAPVVARVLERMINAPRSEIDTSLQGHASDGGLSWLNEMGNHSETRPPSYDGHRS